MGSDLFDLHTALRRGDEDGLPPLAVDDRSEVVLFFDVERFCDEDLVGDHTLWPRLVVDQFHPDELLASAQDVFRSFGEFYPAPFTPSACMHLDFNHRALQMQMLDGMLNFCSISSDFKRGNGDVVVL